MRHFVKIGDVYVDPHAVEAVFPPEPDTVGCCTVLTCSGHLLEVDMSAGDAVRVINDGIDGSVSKALAKVAK